MPRLTDPDSTSIEEQEEHGYYKENRFKERKSSWLELFFDLAYVAAIAQLTYVLSSRYSFGEVVQFLFLFLLVFYSWLISSVFKNIYEEEDTFYIFATQVQMIFAVMMSIFVPTVFIGDGTIGFILGYAGTRAIIVLLFLRFYALHPDRAPKTKNLVTGYAIAVCLWIFSLFVPPPFQYLVWVSAFVLELVTPYTHGRGNKKVLLNTYHLPERMGLFVLLVIGESVIVLALVNEIAMLRGWFAWATGAAGLVLMAALWWLYFPYIERFVLGRSIRSLPLFFLTHALLCAGIMVISAGIKNVLEQNQETQTVASVLVSAGIVICVIAFNGIKFSTYGEISKNLFAFIFLSTVSIFIAGVVLEYEIVAILLATVFFCLYVYQECTTDFKPRHDTLVTSLFVIRQ
jgi:low temperature requirement protein LtrA